MMEVSLEFHLMYNVTDPAAGRKTGSQFGRAATVNGIQYVQVFNNPNRLQMSFFVKMKNSHQDRAI